MLHPRLPILDRYIWSRFAIPYFVLLTVTSTFGCGMVAQESGRIALWPVLIASSWSSAFSLLLVFSDLARAGETLALASAGVSIYRPAALPTCICAGLATAAGVADVAFMQGDLARDLVGIGATLVAIRTAVWLAARYGRSDTPLSFLLCLLALGIYYLTTSIVLWAEALRMSRGAPLALCTAAACVAAVQLITRSRIGML